ncbi:MAG: tRNA uridine-5-carboxymethylaminomethyl(34) synthesis GTPase MnmE [bacterium]|nr:tRNA uridine-5-carboxymethylaminomethyl(34) synthesis GTPase MnmE [bacterium]MDD5756570.1 tRNA uridine-5-carboxymethylaminomethyl(34) synthesis GTPase MnmE [bacterium]
MKDTITIPDTIAAIATPPGEGGLAVIRISGCQAAKILSSIFNSQHGINVAKMATHRLYYGTVAEGAASGETVMVTIMRAPHSYTGENVVEIFAHGGILIAKSILQNIVSLGARLAEPGEFTKRAFLNNKIDLNQAEAVADVIAAKTETALKIGLNQLDGTLAKAIKSIKRQIINCVAQLEAEIDYAEEEITRVGAAQMGQIIRDSKKSVDNLVATYEQGKIIKNGVSIAIIGRPNVGKSSILNRLLKEEKAIVTAIPGTTRDVIEEVINIQGIPVRLMDTAGVRNSKGIIEKMGLRKTAKAIQRADILLWIIDGSKCFNTTHRGILRKTQNKPVIIVINKADLQQRISRRDLEGFIRGPIVQMSAKTGKGLKELESAIAQNALHNNTGQSDLLIITNQRQFECLSKAGRSLAQALDSSEKQLGPEYIVVDLRKSLSYIGELIGETVNDDILKVIFSKFCVGK